MKFLVLGHLGYVGSVLGRELTLAEAGTCSLVGVDAGFFAGCTTARTALCDRLFGVQYFADVRDVCPQWFEGVDGVVMLAAVSNDPMGALFEEPTLDINYRAAVRVATMARDSGVSAFVYASSCSVYGTADAAPRNESATVQPLTAYARSKVMTEQELMPLASPKFRVTCLRFATAAGPSPRLRLDLVLNDFVASALTAGQIRILSDGTPWRPLIDVRDMSRAIHWGLTRSDGPEGLIVNVGAEDANYRVRDIAETVRRALDVDIEVSIAEDAPKDLRSYRVDFSLFRALAPHHQPQVSLEASARDVAATLRPYLPMLSDFRESDLIRLRVLRALVEAKTLSASLRYT